MSESLKRRRHDEILARWVHARTPGHADYRKPDYDDSHIRSLRWAGSFPVSLEEVQSYGPHFPLAQAIPTSRKDRRTRLWLLNGDRWGGASGFGMSTSTQQSQIRSLVASTGIESIILPFSAIDAAGIDHASIRVLAQDAESWQTVTHTQATEPDGIEWIPGHELVPGTGYGTRPNGTYASMEEIPADIRAYFDDDGSVKAEYVEPIRKAVHFGRTHRDWNAPKPRRDYATAPIRNRYDGTLEVPPVYRFTGMRPSSDQKRDANGDWYAWERNADNSWTRTTHVHTLGQSVFRAAYTGADRKRHWANFLSGVDNTPHGSGYFLVQLPRKAETSSVAAAIESLKPPVVVTAESYGIDVKRQGDLFAVPTEYSMRDLRRMGADIRQSSKASEGARNTIRERANSDYLDALARLGIPSQSWASVTEVQRRNRMTLAETYRDRATREQREFDARMGIHLRRELYGTRHVGTDIAILPSGVTLARGTIRHTGGQHRYLSLGKVWHIVARNTVPLAR